MQTGTKSSSDNGLCLTAHWSRIRATPGSSPKKCLHCLRSRTSPYSPARILTSL
jgi:hypothetical protein